MVVLIVLSKHSLCTGGFGPFGVVWIWILFKLYHNDNLGVYCVYMYIYQGKCLKIGITKKEKQPASKWLVNCDTGPDRI